MQAPWREHTQALARDRERTEDALDLLAHAAPVGRRKPRISPLIPTASITRAQKEAIRRAGLFNEDGDYATPSAASSW